MRKINLFFPMAKKKKKKNNNNNNKVILKIAYALHAREQKRRAMCTVYDTDTR